MIPNNLPYRTFPRDWVDEQPTWYQYITGQFNGEMWWERDEINKARMDSIGYPVFPFAEELTDLHEDFLVCAHLSRFQDDEYEPGILATELDHPGKPHFPSDTQCRFDIWTLYNQTPTEVELDIGGAARIEILPKQQDISGVPPLQDTVPPEVPLIFGKRLYTPRGEPSIPHRPFVKNNPQISNFITMQNYLQKAAKKHREKKKRQQRQNAQHQQKQREKYRNAQRQRNQRQQRENKSSSTTSV